MEIRVSKNEINLDIKSLATQYLKDKGFPIPDNVQIEEDGEEIIVVFDSDNAAPTPAPKPASRSRSKGKAEKPAPPQAEVITTHPNSFVQGDAVVDEAVPKVDVFPLASDPEVAPDAPSTAASVFAQVPATSPAQADETVGDTAGDIFA